MGPLVHGIGGFHTAQGPGVGGVAQIVHGIGDGGSDAVFIHVDLQISGEIGAFGDLCEHRLPGFDHLVPFFFIIGIIEYPLILEEEHIRADVVEAEIDVIAVVGGGDHGIVADRGQDPAHGGIFLVGKFPLLGLVQMVGIVEDIVHLTHEDAGGINDHVHHQGQAEDEEEALDGPPDDLTHGLLLLALCVEQLADDRPAGKHENQDHADDGHAPIDVADRFIGEEDVDQIILSPVVGDGLQAREHLEQLHEDADQPAKRLFEIIEQPEYQQFEDTFQQTGDTVTDNVSYTAYDSVQQLRSLPSIR